MYVYIYICTIHAHTYIYIYIMSTCIDCANASLSSCICVCMYQHAHCDHYVSMYITHMIIYWLCLLFVSLPLAPGSEESVPGLGPAAAAAAPAARGTPAFSLVKMGESPPPPQKKTTTGRMGCPNTGYEYPKRRNPVSQRAV